MDLSEHNIIAQRLETMAQLPPEEAMQATGVILRVANPDSTLMEAIQARFNLDALQVKDTLNASHPPHFFPLHQGFHLILRFPVHIDADREHEFDLTSISLLVDERMCALIWPGDRYHVFPDQEISGKSTNDTAVRIIHTLVNRLLYRVHELRDEMDDLEDDSLEDAERADLQTLLRIRKALASLARAAQANHFALEKLAARPEYNDNVRLSDAMEHMRRATVFAETKAEHALIVMQAIQSMVGQKLNEVMKFLAMITFVLTPLAVITGIFGMNFKHMDILALPWGFAATLWGMLAIGIGLLLFFKNKKWW